MHRPITTCWTATITPIGASTSGRYSVICCAHGRGSPPIQSARSRHLPHASTNSPQPVVITSPRCCKAASMWPLAKRPYPGSFFRQRPSRGAMHSHRSPRSTPVRRTRVPSVRRRSRPAVCCGMLRSRKAARFSVSRLGGKTAMRAAMAGTRRPASPWQHSPRAKNSTAAMPASRGTSAPRATPTRAMSTQPVPRRHSSATRTRRLTAISRTWCVSAKASPRLKSRPTKKMVAGNLCCCRYRLRWCPHRVPASAWVRIATTLMMKATSITVRVATRATSMRKCAASSSAIASNASLSMGPIRRGWCASRRRTCAWRKSSPTISTSRSRPRPSLLPRCRYWPRISNCAAKRRSAMRRACC